MSVKTCYRVNCTFTDAKTGITKSMEDMTGAELRRVWAKMARNAMRCFYGSEYEVKMKKEDG